jgi:hypothetical protein
MGAHHRIKPISHHVQFEIEYDEWQRNRDKYIGIRPRPENYSWYLTIDGKNIGSRKTLAEIVKLKSGDV